MDEEQQTECGSCGGEFEDDKCPKSKRPCGHHCNHVWTHDACDWCGVRFCDDACIHTATVHECLTVCVPECVYEFTAAVLNEGDADG